MSDEFGNEEVVFLKVDVDEVPEAAAKYSVQAMPTFVSSVCLLAVVVVIVAAGRSYCIFNSRFHPFFPHSILTRLFYFWWVFVFSFLLFISFSDDLIDIGIIIYYRSLLRVVKLLKQSCKSLFRIFHSFFKFVVMLLFTVHCIVLSCRVVYLFYDIDNGNK